jgi:hypothetical protein
MSIITRIQDALSGEKRTHYRRIGKHMIHFCKRASKLAVNEHQRRVLMSAAISVDEVVAALLGLEQKRNVASFRERRAGSPVPREEILSAMKSYLSALLIICSTFKEALLAKTGMRENDFMAAWRSAFEYSPADRRIFDEELVPAFRDHGMSGLLDALGRFMVGILFQDKHPLSGPEVASLQGLLLDDTAAIQRYIEKK